MSRPRAVKFTAYGETPTLVSVEEPPCPPDGVLIEVHATGVCRSDWHAWQGHDPVQLPDVPGHELAGVVIEVGPEVARRQVGERVTVPFICGCGRCEFCLAGDAQVCPQQTHPGFTGPGSFAELVAIDAADVNVVPLSRLRRLRDGVLSRLPVRHGVPRSHRPRQSPARRLGGGPQVRRPRTVRGDDRGRTGRTRLGAEMLVSGGEEVATRVLEATGGDAHVSLDAVGSTATALASVDCLRPRGRHV